MPDYRDDLAAAHARIAELEEKIAMLERRTEPPPADGAFPELEAEVARQRELADPKRSQRKQLVFQLIAIVFPLLGTMFTLLHLPLVATACSVGFMVFLVIPFILRSRLGAATRALAGADQRLADARRMRDLEGQLAAAVAKVRVDVPASTPAHEDELEEDVRASTGTKSRGRAG